MKSLAVALLIALAALGGAAVTDAQTGAAPAPSATPPSSGTGSMSAPDDAKGPAASQPQPSARSDDGSALPRAATGERTTIFGLSPTAAVIIAAALLVVVILAIIAMTRSDDTYIER
jgi:disulfide bond formation protein DsbB